VNSTGVRRLSRELNLFADRFLEASGPLPTRSDVAEPHDALVVNQHVGRKCAHRERTLDLPVAVPVLRPNHLVLGDERPPLFPLGPS